MTFSSLGLPSRWKVQTMGFLEGFRGPGPAAFPSRCVAYRNFDPLRILRRGSNFYRFFVLTKLSIKTESKHA